MRSHLSKVLATATFSLAALKF